ncbi:MAG: ATP-binding cassette domain-containing protein [Lachnospiraceae bacterium]|nr:ATP-binding cassette domain-containing protein [Candidatus Merdinaster equi]
MENSFENGLKKGNKTLINKHKNHTKLYFIISALIWLAVWEISALILAKPLILPDITMSITRLIQELADITFYQSLWGTLWQILVGFFPAMILGITLGFSFAGRPFLHALISPLCSLMKAIPIAAIVVLLLISLGSAYLAIPVVFFIVFPQFYYSVREATLTEDSQIIEMSETLEINRVNRILFIHKELLAPSILATFKVSIGMAFKSGIAAQLIAISSKTIGTLLYDAKLSLDTAGVFAYIIAILIISVIIEKIILALFTFLLKPWGNVRKNRITSRSCTSSPTVADLSPAANSAPESCAFADSLNLSGIKHSPDLESQKDETHPNVNWITGPSGCGKTTLLKSIRTGHRGVLFQEDRLLSKLDAVRNVRLGCSPEYYEKVPQILEQLLTKEMIYRPVHTLSGGEKRRVALVRAMLAPTSSFYLDEPFSGLDKKTATSVFEFITETAGNRPIYIAHHNIIH